MAATMQSGEEAIGIPVFFTGATSSSRIRGDYKKLGVGSLIKQWMSSSFTKKKQKTPSSGGGGMERAFRQFFTMESGEKLVKASICYLSTTSGPVAGVVFVSTSRVASLGAVTFVFDDQAAPSSPTRVNVVPYKVVIPLRSSRRHCRRLRVLVHGLSRRPPQLLHALKL